MADRPILFSAPMIRALLAGTKTQTRRLLKPQITQPFGGIFRDGSAWWTGDSLTGEVIGRLRIPYAPGDRLWVREAWNCFVFSQDGDEAFPTKKIPTAAEFRETKEEAVRFDMQVVHQESDRARKWFKDKPWRPSIHMPRWASRLTLTVTEVRVQLLQEINEADAVAEGIEDVSREVAPSGPPMSFWRRYRDGGWNSYVDSAVGSYASLWTSLHGPGSWGTNPWVVAVSFDVRKGNIDG